MKEIARALLLVCLPFNAVPALASPDAVRGGLGNLDRGISGFSA